jgi:RNA polymerase sigma-70 factor (ECF subfamily)
VTAEPASLARLFRERRTSLVATLAAMSGDAEAAADAVDEAFVRAAQRWERVSAMASPTGWILIVARNHLRRSKTRSRRRAEAETQSTPTSWVEPDDPRHELWVAVSRLAPREREAVALRYLADLTEPEVARVMGVAVGTVGATLTAARRHLATQLEPREVRADD